jgi:hypothetical protein
VTGKAHAEVAVAFETQPVGQGEATPVAIEEPRLLPLHLIALAVHPVANVETTEPLEQVKV